MDRSMNAIKEGDILLANWGYEANNPNYFKVLKRTAKQVILMQLKTIIVSRDNHPLGGSYVVPSAEPATHSVWFSQDLYDEGPRKPAIIKKKVHSDEAGNEHIELANYAWAYLWNGQPAHDYNYH